MKSLAMITRISDSDESPDSCESCESIRANHATKFGANSGRKFKSSGSLRSATFLTQKNEKVILNVGPARIG